MSTITIEFPDNLTQQIYRQGISQEQLNKMILQFVQIYVNENEQNQSNLQNKANGAEFARRIIAHNRQLFEELAKL